MHTMILRDEHEGTEEWICPACGRHLLVSWYPVFRKTVLEEGDPSEKHTGLKKTPQTKDKMDAPAALLPKPPQDPYEDPRLLPWLTWMDEIGFENLWEGEGQ